MNPNGLVPTLVDEHVTLFESAAILRYLAARHGRFPFWPEDPVARAPVDMWAEWGKTTLQPSFVGPVWFPLLLGRAGPGDPAWDKARAGFETSLDILEAQLGRQPLGNGRRLHPRRHRDRPPALPLLHHRHGPPRPPDAGRLLRSA